MAAPVADGSRLSALGRRDGEVGLAQAVVMLVDLFLDPPAAAVPVGVQAVALAVFKMSLGAGLTILPPFLDQTVQPPVAQGVTGLGLAIGMLIQREATEGLTLKQEEVILPVQLGVGHGNRAARPTSQWAGNQKC